MNETDDLSCNENFGNKKNFDVIDVDEDVAGVANVDENDMVNMYLNSVF